MMYSSSLLGCILHLFKLFSCLSVYIQNGFSPSWRMFNYAYCKVWDTVVIRKEKPWHDSAWHVCLLWLVGSKNKKLVNATFS